MSTTTRTASTTVKKATKRKSLDSSATPANRPKKKPRQTLDSFFSAPLLAVVATGDGDGAVSHVALSPEQTRVLRMVVDDGKNVFFTGAAGTGKSLLLRAIITGLRKKYANNPEAVAVTASTGMAASNIGGQTIHAWGAIAPTVDDMEMLIKCIKTCRPALKRWKSAKVLIIDEISMVDGYLFNRISEIAKLLRKKSDSKKPFGGLQVVVTGDFFQLPPVTKGSFDPHFAFESGAWHETMDYTVNLVKVFRQKEQGFVDALNSLRLGDPTIEAVDMFTGLSRDLEPLFIEPTASQASSSSSQATLSQRQRMMTEVLPTELFSHRADVSNANQKRLAELRSMTFTYKARDSGDKPHLLDNLLADASIDLKLGAQVMLVKNVDEVLVNGLVGKVVGFYRSWQLHTAPLNRAPLSSFNSGTSVKPEKVKSEKVAPVPSAATKKNAAMLRNVLLDETGKPVLRMKPKEELVKAEVVDTDGGDDKKKARKSPVKKVVPPPKEEELFPLVLFQYNGVSSEGEVQTEAVLLRRDEFTVEDAEGKVLARRVQVPLILAWAMSIHKSQGQTIHRVRVDLRRVFEKGQSYVALSRASSIDGLQVIGFNANKVMAHPKVIEWSKTLDVIGNSLRDAEREEAADSEEEC